MARKKQEKDPQMITVIVTREKPRPGKVWVSTVAEPEGKRPAKVLAHPDGPEQRTGLGLCAACPIIPRKDG